MIEVMPIANWSFSSDLDRDGTTARCNHVVGFYGKVNESIDKIQLFDGRVSEIVDSIRQRVKKDEKLCLRLQNLLQDI
jgi:hypothetical protein